MSKHNELMQHITEHNNVLGEKVYLESYFETEPPERGSWEDGQQVEPDYPAVCTLCYAYINGKEVSEFLSCSIIEKLEVKALEYYLDQNGED